MLLYSNKITSSFDAVLLDSKLGQNSKEYTYVQNNFQRLWARFKFNLIFGSKIFDGRLNRSITNKLCSHGTFRPDRLSCKSDYTSYSSLTDMSYYSRHLEPASQEFMDSLPDIDTVVTLFQRPKNADGAEVQTLCTRSTLLFPTFAQHLIDSFIVTSYDPKIGFDWRKTKSPHDICLLPLYGGTEEQTTQLRLGSNEVGQKGRMKSQILNGEEWPPFLYDSQGMRKEEFDKLPLPLFIDHTLNGLPDVNERKSKIFAYGGARANITPNVSAWNALLLREHNRIAGEIEKSEPSWDDNRVFETARNVLLVIYLKLIVEEYIHHISKYGAGVFKVKPGKWMWNASWYKKNWISAEFAVLYRWHAIIPNGTKWGKMTVSSKDMMFHNDLLFHENACDGSLADVFVNISNHRATALTLLNTEEWMAGRDKAAIQQSRACRLKPYCDYAEYVGLARPKAFSDITRKKELQEKLESVYKTVDKVEFWPGLLARDFEQGSIMSDALTRLVAKDAFSQAYTHPLLSENVWKHGEDTFGRYGYALVQEKHSIAQILDRNTRGLSGRFVGMSK